MSKNGVAYTDDVIQDEFFFKYLNKGSFSI